MLLRDLKRGVCTASYWICVAALVLMSYISYRVNLKYYPTLPLAGGLTIFLHATALALGGVFNAIAPLACTIPFSLSYIDDVQTGNIQYQITRMRPLHYYCARAISTSIVAGSVFLSAYAIILICALLYSPTPSFRIDFSPLVVLSSVYDYSLWGYIGVYAINSFLFGCSYALLSMGISAITGSRFLAISLPTVFYHATVFLAWIFPKEIVYDIVRWFPYESFSLQTSSAARLLWAHGLISFIGISLYVYAMFDYRRHSRT